jgi:hypothetical protein
MGSFTCLSNMQQDANNKDYGITLLCVCVCVCVCVQCLKAAIAEPKEMAIARQWLAKHVTMATNTHTTTELLHVAFSMRSVSYQTLNM